MTCRILEDGTFSCQQRTVRNLTLQHLATVHTPEEREETSREILRGLAQVAAAVFGRAGDRPVLYPDEPQLVTPLVTGHDAHLVYQPSVQRFEAIHTPATENFGKLPDVFHGFPKLDSTVSNKLRELETQSRQPIPVRIHPGQAIFNPADFSGAGPGRKVFSVSEEALSQTPYKIAHDGTVLAKLSENSYNTPSFIMGALNSTEILDLFSGNNLFSQNPFSNNPFGNSPTSTTSPRKSHSLEDLRGYLEDVTPRSGFLGSVQSESISSTTLPAPSQESDSIRIIMQKVLAEQRLSDKELKLFLSFLQFI